MCLGDQQDHQPGAHAGRARDHFHLQRHVGVCQGAPANQWCLVQGGAVTPRSHADRWRWQAAIGQCDRVRRAQHHAGPGAQETQGRDA